MRHALRDHHTAVALQTEAIEPGRFRMADTHLIEQREPEQLVSIHDRDPHHARIAAVRRAFNPIERGLVFDAA
jgi:hypothetical protein